MGFNPLALLRGLAEAGLIEPQLKPPSDLPPLEIELSDGALQASSGLPEELTDEQRRFVLAALLDDKNIIINLSGGWFEATESLLLGIPAAMRTSLSFAAGLKFSVSRCHRLTLLADGQGAAKKRAVGQKVDYVDPADWTEFARKNSAQLEAAAASAWISFVERHWSSGDYEALARRTSMPFSDTSVDGRERVAALFNDIDNLASLETDELLPLTETRLCEAPCEVEAALRKKFVTGAAAELARRIGQAQWYQMNDLWTQVDRVWRQSRNGYRFAENLLGPLLDCASRSQPLVAGRYGAEPGPESDRVLHRSQRTTYARRAGIGED